MNYTLFEEESFYMPEDYKGDIMKGGGLTKNLPRKWTEKEIDQLNLKNQKIYDFYKYDCQGPFPYNLRAMSDIARLEIINRFGGYYFDCDFYSWCNDIESIVNLNHDMAILTPENLYPSDCTQDKKKIWWNSFLGDFNSSHFISNGAFYAKPENNILSDLILNMFMKIKDLIFIKI